MNRFVPVLSLFAAMLLPLSARALDETPLSMVFEAPTATRAPTPNTQKELSSALPRLTDCQLALRTLQDVRPHKESAGAAIFMLEGQPGAVPLRVTSLRSGDGTAWLQGAAASLKTAGLPQPVRAPDEGVDLGLRHAQAWTGGMNIHAHVVLQATYPRTGADHPIRRYHGFATKLNGWGANSEFMTTLNMAMQDALVQFAQDMQRACRGEAL
jgi:hypothetical protein